MIAVVGCPAFADRGAGGHEGAGAAGLSVDVADAAARDGRPVEIVGKIGDDGAGDAVVVDLGRRGIGHAALLRDPSHATPVLVGPADAADTAPDDAPPDGIAAPDDALVPDAGGPAVRLLPEDPSDRPSLDAGDVDLALHYLPDLKTVVVADPLEPAALAAAVAAARFAGARLVVLAASPEPIADLPEDATVLEAPADDDGSFGRMIGTFAAGLDAGMPPAAAFRRAVSAAGWEAVAE